MNFAQYVTDVPEQGIRSVNNDDDPAYNMKLQRGILFKQDANNLR